MINDCVLSTACRAGRMNGHVPYCCSSGTAVRKNNHYLGFI